jgi:hypothetical protein
MPDSPSTELRKLIAERDQIYRKRTPGSPNGISQEQLTRLRAIEARTKELKRGVQSATGKRVAELVKKTTGSAWGSLPAQRGGPAKIADAGAADKRRQELLREAMALGPMTGEEGSGAFFETQIDPVTGQMVGINPTDRAKGRLGQVTPGVTGGRSGAGTPKRNLEMLDGLTVADIKKFYLGLTDDELIKVQNQLIEAGFGGTSPADRPKLGFRDGNTAAALMDLITVWQANPKPIKELLGDLRRAHAAEKDPEVRKLAGSGPDGKAGSTARTAVIKLTDESTLGSMIDTIAVDLFGERIDDQRKAQLVAKLQDQERASKTGDAQADYDIMSAEEAAAAGPEASELDRFMSALIGQESGGTEDAVNDRTGAMGLGQIMPDNWGPWAAEAGVDPADFSSGNQRRVIRYKLAQYYANYGNWRDVAVAWYSGSPTSGWSSATLSRGQGPNGDEPSMNDYADQVLGRMQGEVAQGLSAGTQGGLTIQERQSLADPQTRIENELKAMDPAKYFGTQFYKQASNFFSLLRGPE